MPEKRLDFDAIWMAVWLPMAFWLVALLGATLSGYPGVICITHVGWLLSFSAGLRSIQNSTSEAITPRLVEAGIAGALFGAFQCLLFAVVVAFASPLGIPGAGLFETILTTIIAFLVVGGTSTGAGAVLSSGIASLKLRRA